VLTGGLGALALVPAALSKGDEPAKDTAKQRISSNLLGELWIAEPVPLGGPYPSILYVCKVEDIYQFQIQYYIVPPFPKAVDAYSNSPAAIPRDVVLTAGPVAILDATPQTGPGLGVGFLSVYVKAFHPGMSLITAEVTLDDGSVESVPFQLRVDAARSRPRHRGAR